MDELQLMIGRANIMIVKTSLQARIKQIKKLQPNRTDLIKDLQYMVDNLGQTIVCYEFMHRLVQNQSSDLFAIKIVNEQQRLDIIELENKIKHMENYYGTI